MGLPGCIRQTLQELTMPGRSVILFFVHYFMLHLYNKCPGTLKWLIIDFCVVLLKNIRQMQLAAVPKLWGSFWRRITQTKPLLVTTRQSSWLSKLCLRWAQILSLSECIWTCTLYQLHILKLSYYLTALQRSWDATIVAYWKVLLWALDVL